MPSKNSPLILNGTCCRLSQEEELEKMKKTNLLAVLALAASSFYLHAQSTVSTPVVGFEKKSFPIGSTAQGVGFVLAAQFQGTASSVTANNLSTASSSFSANAYAPVGGLPSHYIQITSGPQTGLVVDIIGNSATTLNVSTGDLSSVSGTTPSFVVRPHLTAAQLFQGNTSLGDYSDTLLVYNSDGTSTTILRDSSSSTGWVNPETLSPQNLIIYPGQGFLLNTQGEGNFTVTGLVNPTQTIVPLYSGKVNLVSLSNPSNSKQIQSINLGANLEAFADTVGTFSSDGSLAQVGTYLWAGSADGGFVNPETLSPVVGVAVGGTSAVIVNTTFDVTWTLASPLSP